LKRPFHRNKSLARGIRETRHKDLISEKSTVEKAAGPTWKPTGVDKKKKNDRKNLVEIIGCHKNKTHPQEHQLGGGGLENWRKKTLV